VAKKEKKFIVHEPIANLLPKSLIERRKTNKARGVALRMIAASVVFSAILAATPYGYSSLKQIELNSLNNEINQIISQQAQYSDIVELQKDINSIERARASVAVAEIDWSTFIVSLESSVPEGIQLGALNMTRIENTQATNNSNGSTTDMGRPSIEQAQITHVDASENPDELTAEEKGETPTLQFTTSIQTDSLEKLNTWKNALQSLKGFYDVDFLTSNQGESQYTVSVTLYFTDSLLWNRFSQAQTTTEGSTN